MKLKSLLLVFLLVLVSAKAWAKYDLPYVGDQIEYTAEYEDTFVYLARDYNLGFVEMRAANPDIDPWIPGEGTKLVLPTRHLLPNAPRDGIVINLPEMRLYKFFDDGKAPESFPIGVGREGLSTPTGQTKVVRKVVGPVWRPTPRMRKEDPDLPESVPAGPENPMGTHALYLGWPQYAIHGTNRPFGIGRRISSGCIRLYPEDISELYKIVPKDTPVTVVNQPIKVAWIGDDLYVEAHPNIEQAIQMEEEGYVRVPSLDEADFERIIEVAGEYEDRLHWPVVRKVVLERRGYPVKVASRPSRESVTEETKKPDQEDKSVKVAAGQEDEADDRESTEAGN